MQRGPVCEASKVLEECLSIRPLEGALCADSAGVDPPCAGRAASLIRLLHSNVLAA